MEPGQVTVRAAGGVVVRVDPDGGSYEVLVVHRPRYDDWSFPKGKNSKGESDEDCALREVEEETGLRCRLVAPLSPTSYIDHRGRPKVVRYWLMEPEGGQFVLGDEVDAIRWLAPHAAADFVSYGHDQELAREAARTLSGDN